MQKGLIRKGLVFSVIVLFIGVGFQPVFAGESITKTIDNEEDCIECQELEGYSLLKTKLLLFKVKVFTSVILSSRFGKIPEIKENCQEIIDSIKSNNPLYFDLICGILMVIILPLAGLQIWASQTLDELDDTNPSLAKIFEIMVFLPITGMFASIYATGMLFGCFDSPHP